MKHSRKLLFLLMAPLMCALVILCSCSASENEPEADWLPASVMTLRYHNKPLVKDYQGVTFTIHDATSDSASVTVECPKKYQLYFGYGYDIYKYEDSDWVLLSTVEHEGYVDVWPAVITSNLPYLDPNKQGLDFNYYFDGLEPGTYRFVQSVYCVNKGEQVTDYSDYAYVFSEFTIE